MSYEMMKDKFGRVIVNRNTCVHCDRFRWCSYKLWHSKPSDCPKDEEQNNEKNN